MNITIIGTSDSIWNNVAGIKWHLKENVSPVFKPKSNVPFAVVEPINKKKNWQIRNCRSYFAHILFWMGSSKGLRKKEKNDNIRGCKYFLWDEMRVYNLTHIRSQSPGRNFYQIK